MTRSPTASSLNQYGSAEENHAFSAFNALLLVALLLLSIASGYLLRRAKFWFIAESGASLLIGIVAGLWVRLLFPISEREFLRFKPELFFFALLPPIIFEAGFTLKKRRFFENFGTILLFAVVGTLISTFVVGLLVFAVAGGGRTFSVNGLLQSLLFGALISSVDPVATLSIMGNPEMRCDPLLYSLVFGESVLNDAVAIVLFHAFNSFAGDEQRAFKYEDIKMVLLRFIATCLGSVLVGVGCGLVCSFLFKRTDIAAHGSTFELQLLFLFAFGSFFLAEFLGLSGVMSIFFTGVAMSHYTVHCLSDGVRLSATHVAETIARLAEACVFVYLGTSLFTTTALWEPSFVIIAIVLIVLGRLCNIVPLSILANRCWRPRDAQITPGMQLVMFFAGLRGAVAYALAMQLSPIVGGELGVEVIQTTTLAIVILSTFLLGGTTDKVLEMSGMKNSSRALDDEDFDDEDVMSAGSGSGRMLLERVHRHGSSEAGVRHPINRWESFDNRILKPLFGGERTDSSVAPRPQSHYSRSRTSIVRGAIAVSCAVLVAVAILGNFGRQENTSASQVHGEVSHPKSTLEALAVEALSGYEEHPRTKASFSDCGGFLVCTESVTRGCVSERSVDAARRRYKFSGVSQGPATPLLPSASNCSLLCDEHAACTGFNLRLPGPSGKGERACYFLSSPLRVEPCFIGREPTHHQLFIRTALTGDESGLSKRHPPVRWHVASLQNQVRVYCRNKQSFVCSETDSASPMKLGGTARMAHEFACRGVFAHLLQLIFNQQRPNSVVHMLFLTAGSSGVLEHTFATAVAEGAWFNASRAHIVAAPTSTAAAPSWKSPSLIPGIEALPEGVHSAISSSALPPRFAYTSISGSSKEVATAVRDLKLETEAERFPLLLFRLDGGWNKAVAEGEERAPYASQREMVEYLSRLGYTTFILGHRGKGNLGSRGFLLPVQEDMFGRVECGSWSGRRGSWRGKHWTSSGEGYVDGVALAVLRRSVRDENLGQPWLVEELARLAMVIDTSATNEEEAVKQIPAPGVGA